MNPKKFYINTDAAAQNVIELISDETTLALDTEFIREKTYYPELSLIQIASREFSVCIGCLSGLNLEPVVYLLLRPDHYWILHSARQDLEVIYGLHNQLPEKIYDTQIAAGLAGFAPQISLQALLNDLLNIQLAKEYSRTDWSHRPLSTGALNYAFDDVRYLTQLWEALRERAAVDAATRANMQRKSRILDNIERIADIRSEMLKRLAAQKCSSG